uniref:Uncharacterized protein n=1 Tax=Chromera velia CCMP2878 TaxID=1169474 RepID=A0A0G4GAK2_9ALVE|eukprot:Cvel_21017.t1-p1 / transcript=Cvel_21017.t1 / gene=Cvel_21017 / organism=Chromera_velia_CCMP2878 / gene_product=Ankyrin repeat domain-containing protein 50, putative / transcript_product=Ankyrin repeat domain-containing protein 50, putative / location=Cvel_scaffold1937:3388-9350(-) / protein_length=274 / sequence_SO=supercontig / SO=protein_coding / is_pseudo=false
MPVGKNIRAMQPVSAETLRTAVVAFLQTGNEGDLRILLFLGADVNKGVDGKISLWVAAEAGATRAVQLLLIMPHKKRHRETLLMTAALNGYRDVVELLLEKSKRSLEVKDWHGRTPFFGAALLSHLEVATLLLEWGAEVDAEDNSRRTPLWFAAHKGREALVDMLLEKGAHKEAADTEYERTPLIATASEGHTEVVRRLLKAGSRVNAVDSKGLRPLHHAVMQGNQALVSLLLEKGADVNAPVHGKTPLTMALESNDRKVRSLSSLLIAKGGTA